MAGNGIVTAAAYQGNSMSGQGANETGPGSRRKEVEPGSGQRHPPTPTKPNVGLSYYSSTESR